jgi:aminoglycoside phosphotransferase (APT) family kinase protein
VPADAPTSLDAARRLAAERLPGWPVERAVAIEAGWDSVALELDGAWIVRVPRRAEVRRWMAAEAALLATLAPCLPVPVPAFAHVEHAADGVALVAYRKLPGTAIDRASADAEHAAAIGACLGRFLAALHRFPHRRALPAAVTNARPEGWFAHERAFWARCEREVLPLLEPSERARAAAMQDAFLAHVDESRLALIHGDLGPEHILCDGPAVTGVIDWSDAHVGDPALDFGWLLHGTPPALAGALWAAYDEAGGALDPGLRARSLYYHRLGPWHEVTYGLEHGRPELVASGLAGVRRRLPG